MRSRTNRLAVITAGLALAACVPRFVRRRDERRSSVSELSGSPPPLASTTVSTRDGAELYVGEIGAGTPLVLIHGLSLSHDLWRYQFIDLADEFRLVAYDLRGHGRSTIGTEGIGPHQSAADLVAVLETLDLRGVVLVGHSIGGTVVGQFCADHVDVARERVAGLVFVDSFASAIAGEGRLRELCSPAITRAGAAIARRRRRGSTAMAYVAARAPFGPHPEAEQVNFTLELGEHTAPAVSSAATIANLSYDVREAIGAIDIPALVLRGSADRLSTARSTAQLREALVDPTVELIAGVGHLPMLEARAAFNEILTGFVRQVVDEPDRGDQNLPG